VDDAFRMGRTEPFCDCCSDLHGFTPRARRAPHSFAQRFSMQQFHHGETCAPFLPQIEDRHDVWVRERRDRHGLALETCPGGGIVCQVLREDLDRHIPAQPQIARTVDLTHTSSPQGRQDFVRSQSGSGR
jgi:hypothetical protein